jgi:metal-sulfur cluster biosynthetic enzyme
MSNRFYNENVEKFMSEESKYSDTQIEEIKTKILAALETVIDPELGIDIINLGLVYEISFEDNGFTEVKMTLTTMGCPLADVLTDQIHDALKEVEEVTEIKVNLVWYPAWTVDKMSRYARIALGIR